MDFGKIPLLSGLAARLDFLSARTSVIATNIANADTPDYAAKDLQKPDFGKLASAAQMRVSDPRHIPAPHGSIASGAGVTGLGDGAYRVKSAPDGEASLTGNQVSIETQAMKLAETRSQYALATSVYRKGLAMLRIAVRGE
ncbi:MAG: hypothetical protein HKN14_09875 [Marinicaulis sp.]|nr:hypothetical protein [Marinicaulis sp.]NNE41210.1 hypothetical protein [Marinicaulis sp.]NNL88362.1 hypothetical protein [Marinicaulis sp.]